MAEISELTKQIDMGLQGKKELFDSIRYGRNHIKNKLQKKSVRVEEASSASPIKTKSKEEIYNELKDRYRFAWKSPGYCNDEFSEIPVLRGKILTTWDRDRALMPERSYKAPKGFRGMKIPYNTSEFGEPSENLLPKLYKTHLEIVKKDYNDRVMRPSKYGPIKEEILISNLFCKEQERGWKKLNTVQMNDFGFGTHSTHQGQQTFKPRPPDNATR